MRTNIEINADLMTQVLAATGLTTKRAAVDAALRLMLQLNRQKEILELAGTAVSTKCAKAVSSTRNDCRRQLVSITHLTDRATTSFASATGAPEMRY